jgi:hypothetical protein
VQWQALCGLKVYCQSGAYCLSDPRGSTTLQTRHLYVRGLLSFMLHRLLCALSLMAHLPHDCSAWEGAWCVYLKQT